MRTFLLAAVVVEGLAAAAILLVFAPSWLRKEAPPVPVFRPPIADAVIGETATYRKTDVKTGEHLGFVTYRVRDARAFQGLADAIVLQVEIIEEDKDGKRRQRHILHQVQAHSWLPPFFEEEELPRGELPVVKTIETEEIELRGRRWQGFRVDAVRPRWSLSEVRDTFWMAEDVAVYGVVRAVRQGVEWTLHNIGEARA